MNWTDLQLPVRAAILVGAFLLAVVLVWSFIVGPVRATEVTLRQDIAQAEGQLEQLEREIESIPPASPAETAAWQRSQAELTSRLGPESELPLLLESLIRLAEGQGVEIFVNSEASNPLAGQQRGRRQATASDQATNVLSAVPGARYVPLNVRLIGDYDRTARFVGQVGRLGWVTEVLEIHLERDFPEVVTDIRLAIYFRPDDAGSRPAGRGGMGGGF